MQMMELKGYSPETLERMKDYMWRSGNYGASRNISEFQQTFGFLVKVVRGRKVKHGTIGRCFWMGTRNYAKYSDPWGLKTVTRIGIRDEAGNVYWTSIENVEVIPGTYEAPAKKVKKYDEVYYTVTVRPLNGKKESPALRELRERLEAASARYNELCNQEAELIHIEAELEKSGKEDEELSRQIDKVMDEREELHEELERLDREHRKLWSGEIEGIWWPPTRPGK